MSKGVEPILVVRQEIIVLPRIKPIVVEGVHVVVKVRYNEPRLINKMEALLEESPGIRAEKFMV
jgi:hypothetical protein